MKIKTRRLETIKQLISSEKLGNQADLLRELRKEGYFLTQATLSRDLKQLKVAKAATMDGQYIYVLPNETMYHRVHTPLKATQVSYGMGFHSMKFSGNMGVIRTSPGYASSLAFNIDNDNIPEILGTIAGDDTIFIVIADGADHNAIVERIKSIISL